MWRRLPWRELGCATILVALAACASDSRAVSDFCLIYEPVYVSDSDSAETVDQVMRNNAAWNALCGYDTGQRENWRVAHLPSDSILGIAWAAGQRDGA